MVLVVEQTVSFRSPATISSIQVICKMERGCAWSLEMESKLAEVILQREKWNLFWDHISYVENHQKINLETQIFWGAELPSMNVTNLLKH